MTAVARTDRRRRKAPAKPVQGTISSEIRVLRLLEYFSHVRDEVTVMEVARALDIPQSSTSTLLSRLVESGYVGHDRWRRVYYPTARAALIGLQLVHKLPYGDGVLDLMGRLSEVSGAAVFLNTMNRNAVQTIHVIEPDGSRSVVNGIGAKYHIVTSTPGRMILASAPGTHAYGLVRRHNAEVRAQDRVNLRTFLDGLTQVRERGYAVSRNGEFMPRLFEVDRMGGSARCSIQKNNRLSMALPASNWLDTLAVTLGFPQDMDAAQEADFAEAVKGEVGTWIAQRDRAPLHFSVGARH